MYLGIDLGTSSVKSILIDDEQRLIGEASSAPLDVVRAMPGWSEQDPAIWWRAVCETLDSLGRAHPVEMSAVEGIGLSGQMYGATVLDEADRPLRPAILWNDTRSAAQCAELERRVPNIRSIAGRKPTPGVTASKLMWLAANEPETFSRVRKVLLPKDYIRMLLTGEKVSDLADASGTMWVDLKSRTWSEELLSATGLSEDHMPRLCEGTEVSGRLRPGLAQRWGMARLPVVAGGGGDNACGACGTGVIEDGHGTVSLGTSGVLFVANNSPRIAEDFAIETLCHAVPDRWHQMSVVLSATSCLTWLSKRLKRSPEDLIQSLGAAPRPATDVIFTPFLDGCWSPRNDANIRGSFHGIAHQHDDEALTQAVLQGVAFAIAECAEAFRESGTELKRLMAIGGGSRSPLWLSILATALDTELELPDASALGAAFGAARLGMIAATGARPREVLRRPNILDVVPPAAAYADSYTASFRSWKRQARAN